MAKPQNLDADTIIILSDNRYYKIIAQLSSEQVEIERLLWITQVWLSIENKFFNALDGVKRFYYRRWGKSEEV